MGKIPKAFKIIPALSNWEEVLYLTNPDKWSPHAMFQATRLFASNLNAKMAQRFYSLVLLPRVRDDIAEHKRLHFALYQALKKATFKPAAFYKGILIPLCASRTCTLREAVVLSSVLTRGSIPMLHSAAALLKLAELPYAGTTSFFLRVLLDKKYALPFRVVDALVDHFPSFQKRDPGSCRWCGTSRCCASCRGTSKRFARRISCCCVSWWRRSTTTRSGRRLSASSTSGGAGVRTRARAPWTRMNKTGERRRLCLVGSPLGSSR